MWAADRTHLQLVSDQCREKRSQIKIQMSTTSMIEKLANVLKQGQHYIKEKHYGVLIFLKPDIYERVIWIY